MATIYKSSKASTCPFPLMIKWENVRVIWVTCLRHDRVLKGYVLIKLAIYYHISKPIMLLDHWRKAKNYSLLGESKASVNSSKIAPADSDMAIDYSVSGFLAAIRLDGSHRPDFPDLHQQGRRQDHHRVCLHHRAGRHCHPLRVSDAGLWGDWC